MFDNVNRHFSIRKEDRDVIFGMAIHVDEEKPEETLDPAIEDANAVDAYVLENSGTTIDDLIDIDSEEEAQYGITAEDSVSSSDDADDIEVVDDIEISDNEEIKA